VITAAGHAVEHDALGTHFRWRHPHVTAAMIDWFWMNMEKGFVLWHPEQHEPLEWVVPPADGAPLGAIHNAPQTWDDGRRQDLYIRFERFADVPVEVLDIIEYGHVMIVAGLGFSADEIERDDPLGYRVHQWEDHPDGGVVGRSTAVGRRKPETPADGDVWAAHASGEIANWGAFLPQLHGLYEVVTDRRRNPHADLSVDGRGREARYRFASGSASFGGLP
jgi:hypothetical protein